MPKYTGGKKRTGVEVSISIPYVALRSQDEIYYQMASIFKAGANDEDDLVKKILSGKFSGSRSEIILENSM